MPRPHFFVYLLCKIARAYILVERGGEAIKTKWTFHFAFSLEGEAQHMYGGVGSIICKLQYKNK